jgi:hypothetical protein
MWIIPSRKGSFRRMEQSSILPPSRSGILFKLNSLSECGLFPHGKALLEKWNDIPFFLLSG